MKFRKATSIVLAFLLIISNYVIVPAATTNVGPWAVTRDDGGNLCIKNSETGAIVAEAWRYNETGQRIDIDLYQYSNILNESYFEEMNTEKETVELNDSANRASIPVTTYAYSESSSSVVNGSAVKVTANIKGPGTITYGNSTTISESFSISSSVDTSSARSTIRSSAGFTWNTSLSTNTSFSVSYNVPSGKTGYVQFVPKLNQTKGTLRVRVYLDNVLKSDLNYSVTAKSPKKLSNGFADGTYSLVYA